MSKKFLTSIDLGASATIISLAPSSGTSDPVGGKAGQIYFNTSANELRYFNPSTSSYQPISSGASGTITIGSTAVSLGGTTSSLTAVNLTSASLGNSWLGAASATSINGTSIPSNETLATQTYANSASSTAYTAAQTYANSASTTAYNNGVTYANSASLTAYSSAISVAATLATTASNAAYTAASSFAITQSNSASTTAYNTAVTYANSASLNAYNLGVTYANSASLNAYTTASAWVAARGYLTSESDTLQTVTGRGATASTAITITNATAATNSTTGALIVTGGAGIGGNLYVGGNLEVSGSGYFGGSAVNISASNLNIADSLVYLATGNSGNVVDIGIVGHYNDGLYQHTGLVRDASDSKYKLFYNVTTEPSTTIDFTSASYSTLQVGGIEIVQPGGTVSAARVYSATIGNGSATTASVTHNLNTRDVTVNVYDASTYDTVEVDVTRTSVNVVVITAAIPLTNNGYRVVVTG